MSTATTPAGTRTVAVERAPARPASFADALRAEWVKLSTIRSTWFTAAITVALGVGLGALISYLSGVHYKSGDLFERFTWDPTEVSFRALGIAQLAVAVLGVMAVSSEYATGMIRTSLTAVPRRGRFLGAKLAVLGAFALLVGEITAFGAFLIGQALIGANAPHTDLGAPSVLRAVLGAGLYLACIALVGSGFGALVRNTAAGISGVVALMFVLPGIAQALPSSWSQPITEFWPTEAGRQILVVQRAAHTLPAWSGFGVLVGFTAVVLAGATFVLHRRDA